MNLILPELLSLSETNLLNQELSLSQPIEILNDDDENNYAFFLFSNRSCIGEIVVSYVNNNFCSSVVYQNFPIVSEAYINAIPISLVSVGESLILCTDNSAKTIIGNYTTTQIENDNQLVSMIHQLESEVLTLNNIEPAYELYSGGDSGGGTVTFTTVDLPYVSNADDPNGGLCWAAVAASMIMHHTNYTNLGAIDIFNVVKNGRGSAPGNPSDVAYALGYYDLSYYWILADGLPYQTVLDSINGNYPIWARIARNGGGHAVAICGYQSTLNGNKYFQLMDPNVSYKVWVSVNESSVDFTYATSYGYTYTEWTHSVYSSLIL